MRQQNIKLASNVIHTWEIDIDEQNFEIARKYIKILSVLEIDKLKRFKFVKMLLGESV